MYECMYEVGSYTCIEGFRLNHDLLSGGYSLMYVCVPVCVLAYVYVVRSWSHMH